MGDIVKSGEKVVISEEFMRELNRLSMNREIGKHLMQAYAGLLYNTIATLNYENKLLAIMDVPDKKRRFSLMKGVKS